MGVQWILRNSELAVDDIVGRQLVADVPRCVLLSGGLDSNALTAQQLDLAGEKVRTFAVDFAGQTENFVPDEFREVFGGYKWFHDPEVQQADTIPWGGCG